MSQLRANTIVNVNNDGSPTFPFGITGITTATNATNAAYAEVAGIASGLTGTPDITVGNIVAVDGTFSGDVSVAGTVSYLDVDDVNVLGVITATAFVGDGSGLTNAFSQEDTWLFGGA